MRPLENAEQFLFPLQGETFAKPLPRRESPLSRREREYFLRRWLKLRKGLRRERVRACPVIDTGVRGASHHTAQVVQASPEGEGENLPRT